MVSPEIKTWSDLIQRHFAAPVKRFFRMGAEVVVLAFDVYDFVPLAKQITQHNRVKRKVTVSSLHAPPVLSCFNSSVAVVQRPRDCNTR